MKKIDDPGLLVGLIIGILAGLIGSILVTAMYRIIDKTPGGHNISTFFIALICLGIITFSLFKILKRSIKND